MPDKSKRDLVGSYTIPRALEENLERDLNANSESNDYIKQNLSRNDYQSGRHKRAIDLDLDNIKPYKEVMNERIFEREEARVKRLIDQKKDESKDNHSQEAMLLPQQSMRKRKKRWDVSPEEYRINNIEKKENVTNAENHIGTETRENMDENALMIHELLTHDKKVPIINGIPLTDKVLDKILPPGYVAVDLPEDFNQNSNVVDITDLPNDYYVPPSTEDAKLQALDVLKLEANKNLSTNNLEIMKEEDLKYFGKLVKKDNNASTQEEKLELKAMKHILNIKNGTPALRKKSFRQLADNAIQYGPKPLLNIILPILLEPNLDLQERHHLLKLTGRIIIQLDDQLRPYTHKILVVISPLLIEEDFTLRLETREVISNLTKAVGLANMVSSLRPDLDHTDEYVRNITSRVFAIVANTLGLVNFLPFLKAVIKSKKNWMARHTGIKIVQQLCILLGGGNGNSILPYLSQLIEVLNPGLTDEALQVRTITALTLAQLADNVRPYGIESFEPILEPTWLGLKKHRGKGLASFLKCIGSIIPLMCNDANYEEYSNYYTKEIMVIIVREFNSPDEDMRKTILKVMMDLPLSKNIIQNYDQEIIKPFLKFFWNRRVASDSQRLSKLVVETTFDLANKFDFLGILECIIPYSKDANESLRRMSIETINKMVSNGNDNLIGLDSNLEVKLVDGVLYAFQEQTIYHKVYLLAFGAISKSLGVRLKPYMNSIVSTILYRLKNKLPEIRQQAADLISILAPTIRVCFQDNESIMMKLILILYESLGEVYPEVLGSIISALYSCLNSVDKASLYLMSNPSINQILPTLTPILKNRQEKVQEACIKLVGLIARKNSETINAREWMRICFELLDMLKSNKKRIRVAANETFGYIARTIGPQDVLVMLLNNLRVQERQLRVCTAVAIGIVAETCAPFTVLPAIMNEYRIPEKNVQNGVLKALSFIFEYINGDMTKDYLFAITPLLEDSLCDRDLVHRQTAATVIKHMALNCVGLTNDDYYEVFIHYLNLLIPNIYETSPHVIIRIIEGIDALRVVLGIGSFSNYIWPGLFHPARKVRAPYWKIYNNSYVQSSDSMVPYYPRIEKLEDSDINYNIDELDIFI